MPDFWIALDFADTERVVLPLPNAIEVDGVRRNGLRLASGIRVDWRWFQNASQAAQAAEQVFWGMNDATDHSTDIPTGPLTISEVVPATNPKTYIRARTWMAGPTDLDRPLAPEKVMPFLQNLPDHGGTSWMSDWNNLRESSHTKRRFVDGVERGDFPFYFATFLRFAEIALGSPPTTPQITAAQGIWATAFSIEVGEWVTDPVFGGTIPAWSAKLWKLGSHVTHNGSTWRATYSHAIPSEEPGTANVWEEVT